MTGSPTGGLCHYLEAAATSGVSAWVDSQYVWSGQTRVAINTTSLEVGSGLANTLAMIAQSSSTAGAGAQAHSYAGPSNLSDWYLPSQKEIAALYLARNYVGGIASVPNSGASVVYASSSECKTSTSSCVPASQMWAQNFTTGGRGSNAKSTLNYVRPIRAF